MGAFLSVLADIGAVLLGAAIGWCVGAVLGKAIVALLNWRNRGR